jgi:hypothetical protein
MLLVYCFRPVIDLSALQSLTICQGPQIYQSKFGATYRVSCLSSIGLLCGTILTLLLSSCLVTTQEKKTEARQNQVSGNAASSAPLRLIKRYGGNLLVESIPPEETAR